MAGPQNFFRRSIQQSRTIPNIPEITTELLKGNQQNVSHFDHRGTHQFMFPIFGGLLVGKQKNMPLMISQMTENMWMGQPKRPKLNDRDLGRICRPWIIKMAWGTVYVIFSISTAVFIIELNAWVLAMYNRPQMIQNPADSKVALIGILRFGSTSDQQFEKGSPF